MGTPGGAACWTWDTVSHSTFTPQEPLVEALRVALETDVILVMLSDADKAFVVQKLLWETSVDLVRGSRRNRTQSVALLLLAKEDQVGPWAQFLRRTLNLRIEERIAASWNTSGGCVIVDTVSAFTEALPGLDNLPCVSLCVIDNGHHYVDSPDIAAILARLEGSRFVTVTASILQHLDDRHFMDEVLARLKRSFPGRLEASCELLSLLRYVSQPRLCLVLYKTSSPDNDNTDGRCSLRLQIEDIILPCLKFLHSHQYSLADTYGEEFQDLIDEIPDPAEVPIRLIQQYLDVLRELGVYSAHKAALLLVIKIDKLKTREKYERHFLLYSIVYTVLMKVRKVCDDVFSRMSEAQRLESYSTPKLLKLMNVLQQYRPEHFNHSKTFAATDAVAADTTTTPENTKVASVQKPRRPHYHHRSSRHALSDDQNTLHGIVFVRDLFYAKVLYHFVKDLSRSDERFSFLSPQYVVSIDETELSAEAAKAGSKTAADAEHLKKQEEALRRFRMKECNVLISNIALEVGVENVRCNLVVAFDLPDSYKSFAFQKVKAKARNAWLVLLGEEGQVDVLRSAVAKYQEIEERLKGICTFSDLLPQQTGKVTDDDEEECVNAHPVEPFFPRGDSKMGASVKTAILHLNRYCAKLPSDTFTRLMPLFSLKPAAAAAETSGYVCTIHLPINSPLRVAVSGPAMKTESLAKRAAALEVLRQLHALKEIDDGMASVGKDGPRKDMTNAAVASAASVPTSEPKDSRQGSVKRRQYYYKEVARHLTSRGGGGERFHLYSLSLTLSCPIPEEQNTRGRKIYPPENSAQSFGILVSEALPAMCAFPIYTRSGEVMVELVHLLDNVELCAEKKEQVMMFHKYTFSHVLRLEKYPMVFSPDKSDNSVLVLPLVKSNDGCGKVIDWDFLREIVRNHDGTKLTALSDEERSGFEFVRSKYVDAVVMPWYRNQDQPQYFYVAEICSHLSPKSDFPAQGFESFEKYYQSKYSIRVQNLEQPLLDVDHTSARLNFLTPRYVNRKGVALPSSSEETKKNKRENLDQKQILVPELCVIHPFRASLWRQTVSLPCIFYRLNGLLIADQIRSLIAREMGIGLPVPPSQFTWDALNFGWTLSDVLKNRENLTAANSPKDGGPLQGRKLMAQAGTTASTRGGEGSKRNTKANKSELESLSDDLVSKMNEEDKRLKKKTLEIGTWSNEMAAQSLEEDEDYMEDDEEDELNDEEEFLFDPNMALPDNLTLLSNDIIPHIAKGSGGGRDWGTGIEQKKYRVGSPTSFANPNINIPGLVDDMDGLSCSDSSDDDDGGHGEDEAFSEDEMGSVRISFRGHNSAEAIEDEKEITKRVELLAKAKEEEEKMLSSLPWSWEIPEGEKSESPQDVTVGKYYGRDVLVVIPCEGEFCRDAKEEYRQSEEITKSEEEEGSALREMSAVRSLALLDRTLPSISDGGGSSDQQSFTSTPVDTTAQEEEYLSFSFDFQPDLHSHPGPSPSLILQAVTMSNSNDAINLERLETIGDSFLKYAITVYLFSAHRSIHEGRLSHLRSKQVSNFQLYHLGKRKGLGECMIASKFEPHDNWLPPCYHIPKDLEQALIESGVPTSHWNMAELPGLDQMDREQIYSLVRQKTDAIKEACGGGGGEDLFASSSVTPAEEMPSFIPYNLLSQHSIPDKSIADCVEALIGAYLIACGQRGALLFMSWLGIQVLPGAAGDDKTSFGSLPSPPSPLLLPLHQCQQQLDFLLHGYDSFEEIIGYKFRDRSYLLQAFTHASYFPNRLTDCYQRLEFLGDAVLDYLITRHLYEDPRKHSPGALTDLRSALVNNTIFASMAVKHSFQKYFKHFSPGLQAVINRFVKAQEENGFRVSATSSAAASIVSAAGAASVAAAAADSGEQFYLVSEDEAEEAEDVEVPKALGDMFESVAGAIFLDSGLSLDAVWRVYYRMMRPEIELFSTNVPKSPIRELLELEPETAKFGKPEKLADGRRVRVTVEVFGKGVYKGIGRNYRIAKCTAAKCALRGLRKIGLKNGGEC